MTNSRRDSRRETRRRVMVALGGNAIQDRGDRGTAEEQLARLRGSARSLVDLIEEGYALAITHGNGPQVGDILLKNEMAKGTLPPMPLDVCGAESQGMIGYMLQQALDEELRERGLSLQVATVLTRTLVNKSDPAFKHPTKPIGTFYGEREASRLRREKGWQLVKDSGRGFRRVVPSPTPVDILEKETILELFNAGTIVIAAGGGGVPVVRSGKGFAGVEAVLDKDRTAALLASLLHADVLLILTDVDRVYINYLGPSKTPLQKVDAPTCQKYLDEGQFPDGSMGPKVEGAIQFLKHGGSRAVITSLSMAKEGLAGKAGTTITP